LVEFHAFKRLQLNIALARGEVVGSDLVDEHMFEVLFDLVHSDRHGEIKQVVVEALVEHIIISILQPNLVCLLFTQVFKRKEVKDWQSISFLDRLKLLFLEHENFRLVLGNLNRAVVREADTHLGARGFHDELKVKSLAIKVFRSWRELDAVMSVEDNYEWWIVLFVAFKGFNQNYGWSLPRHETSSWKVVVECLVHNTEEGSLEWRLEHVRVGVRHVHGEVYFVEVI